MVPVGAPAVRLSVGCGEIVPPVPPVAGDDGLALTVGLVLPADTGGSTATCGGESTGAGLPVLAVCSEVANVEVVADPGAVALL